MEGWIYYQLHIVIKEIPIPTPIFKLESSGFPRQGEKECLKAHILKMNKQPEKEPCKFLLFLLSFEKLFMWVKLKFSSKRLHQSKSKIVENRHFRVVIKSRGPGIFPGY